MNYSYNIEALYCRIDKYNYPLLYPIFGFILPVLLTYYFSDHPGVVLMACYLIFQGFLFFFLEQKCAKEIRKQNNVVVFAENFDSGLSPTITQLIEYYILNRYSLCGYKNAVRANFRIFSSILVTVFFVCLWILLSDLLNIFPSEKIIFSVSTLITVLGVTSSFFIMERKSLYEKWIYLAGLYNKILEQKKGHKRNAMECALAMDLIDMEMWAHRSFRDFFNSVAANAYTEQEYGVGFREGDEALKVNNFLATQHQKQKVYLWILKSQKNSISCQTD